MAGAQALADGCVASGHSVVWQRPGAWKPDCLDRQAEVAVVYGLSGGGDAIRRAYHAQGVPVWILDRPRLRDEATATGVFLDDYQWLPPRPIGRAARAAPVLKDRAKSVVLVCGQVPGDFAHGMDGAGVEAWLREAVATARAAGLPVAVRRHPSHTAPLPADQYGADEVRSADGPLRAALGDVAVVLTHNSGAGWDAIAAGVPVVATDPFASYADYATALTASKSLTAAQRSEALARVASTQFLEDELRDPRTVRWLFAHHARPALRRAA